jgi:hypothetical protein
MIKTIMLSILTTLLFAQNSQNFLFDQNTSLKNPQVYAALGDVIYNNVEKIKKLKNIPQLSQYEDKMLIKKQETTKKAVLSEKEIQEAKIKRIREKDKAKQESIQKALEDELIKKKKEIRKEQVEELTKPN